MNSTIVINITYIIGVIIMSFVVCYSYSLPELLYEFKSWFYNKKYHNKLINRWLSYNLRSKDVKLIINYMAYNCKPCQQNNQLTEKHFKYLLQLLSLNKDKIKLLEKIKDEIHWQYYLAKSPISSCGLSFDKDVLNIIMIKHLYEMI